MQLRVGRDATGNIEYKVIDGNSVRTISESLAKYRIASGQIDNARLNSSGNIEMLDEQKEVGETQKKTDLRLRKEVEAAEVVGADKYRIIAVIKGDNGVAGYIIRNDATGKDVKVTEYTARVYTSIGAVTNARIEIAPDGKERLVGVGCNLSNLAVIDNSSSNGNRNSLRVADGVVEINWAEVVEYKRSCEDHEVIDKRGAMLDGLKYPKTSLMKKSILSINISGKEYAVRLMNIDDLIRDEAEHMLLDVTCMADNKNIKIKCMDASYVTLNILMIALAAFIGLQKLNRKEALSEIKLSVNDGRVWRMYYREDKSNIDNTEDGIEVTNSMLSVLRRMYNMSVNSASTRISEDEQARLLRGLKIGKATLKVMCTTEVYTVTEFTMSIHADSRLDIKMCNNTGDELKFYYKKLSSDKVNIKNIIVLCAAAVADRSEIQCISIEALDRDSTYTIEFTSKIQI